jgi:hypothetical protein
MLRASFLFLGPAAERAAFLSLNEEENIFDIF